MFTMNGRDTGLQQMTVGMVGPQENAPLEAVQLRPTRAKLGQGWVAGRSVGGGAGAV
jgi:hypothetical protein